MSFLGYLCPLANSLGSSSMEGSTLYLVLPSRLKHFEACNKCSLFCLTNAAKHNELTVTAPQLIYIGYLKSPGREKIIVVAKEANSKKFWSETSMAEKEPRELSGASACTRY